MGFLFFCLFSCQKDKLIFIENPKSFDELFETFWHKMNTNYLYWDIDTTNWDEMYNRYKPIFKELKMGSNLDVIRSVQYFQEMTNGLIDGHYYIRFTNPIIATASIYPSLHRREQRPYSHSPYFNIDINYLDPDVKIGRDYNNIINGQPISVLCGTIDNRILFFSTSGFSLQKSFISISPNTVQTTLQYFFNMLADLPESIKGIILDVRGNMGGDLGDLNFFVGHFIDSPLHFGATQSKSGNGRLDYTPWVDAFVNPDKDGKRIEVPIIILADLYSASLAEATVMAIKLLPNTTFIGETTWGATGPITEEALFNAGSFKIPNFLSVQTSSCKFRYLDGKIYEGVGFTPDIFIPYDFNAIINGRDTQLEKAISLIK
jgi:carboxyl-terminal processing protease